MSIPLQVQLFDAFLGTQEGIHSLILPDTFSSGGSKNLWIDKYGRAKKILGYAKLNGTPVTTNTGGSATLLREMCRYRSSSGGTFTRHILGGFTDKVDEFEIWKSTDNGGTWSFVQDLGAGSINSIPDFAQSGNILIFTNGVVAPRSYDGTTWATAGGTQLAAPTASGSTSGNLAGTYRWKIVPIDASGDRSIASVASAATTITDLQQTLDWADSAGVSGYEVYRTTGTGAVFYFVDYVDGDTNSTYVDNTPDLQLLENRVLAEHGDAPPTGAYFCSVHKQRMWYGRTDANPRRIYWSDPGDPDSVWEENFIDFGDAETFGDVVTGMLGDIEGHLIVFTERSVWTVSGTGSIVGGASGSVSDWSRVKANAQTGAVAKRAVTRIPAGSTFYDQRGEAHTTQRVTLAYFTPLGDIRLFDGDNDFIISAPVQTAISTFNYEQRHKFFCIHDTARSEVTWCYATGSDAEPTEAVTWNYRWGVWYARDWPLTCGIEIETTSDASVLLGGSNSTSIGGYAYTLWSTNAFDGVDIEAVWMSKTLFGVNDVSQPALAVTKRWRWVDVLLETDNATTLSISWIPGHAPNDAAPIGTKTFAPASAFVLSADGDTIVDASGLTLVVASSSSQVRLTLKTTNGDYYHDEGIRLRISDNASNGSWSLEGLALAYQLLPGLKRRQ